MTNVPPSLRLRWACDAFNTSMPPPRGYYDWEWAQVIRKNPNAKRPGYIRAKEEEEKKMPDSLLRKRANNSPADIIASVAKAPTPKKVTWAAEVIQHHMTRFPPTWKPVKALQVVDDELQWKRENLSQFAGCTFTQVEPFLQIHVPVMMQHEREKKMIQQYINNIKTTRSFYKQNLEEERDINIGWFDARGDLSKKRDEKAAMKSQTKITSWFHSNQAELDDIIDPEGFKARVRPAFRHYFDKWVAPNFDKCKKLINNTYGDFIDQKKTLNDRVCAHEDLVNRRFTQFAQSNVEKQNDMTTRVEEKLVQHRTELVESFNIEMKAIEEHYDQLDQRVKKEFETQAENQQKIIRKLQDQINAQNQKIQDLEQAVGHVAGVLPQNIQQALVANVMDETDAEDVSASPASSSSSVLGDMDEEMILAALSQDQ